MENQIRTLDQVINNQLSQQGQSQTLGVMDTQSYNAFQTFYSINCAHRFPDVSDLTTIPYDIVRSVARASVAFSRIGLEVWNEETLPQGQVKRARLTQRTA